MIPDVQVIFDSTPAANGAWFYVGKYSLWTLYVTNSNDGTISVEAASIPSNTFYLFGPAANNIGSLINNIQAPVYQPTAGPWKPLTNYALGTLVVDPFGNVQKVTTAGVSGGTIPAPSPNPVPPGNGGVSVYPQYPVWTTTTTNDGTVVWTYQQVQGNPNYNSAIMSSATPAGIIICPSMSATVNPMTSTGFGSVIFTNAAGSPAADPSALYIPGDDLYVAYIRIRKTGGGSAETIAYLCGQVDS